METQQPVEITSTAPQELWLGYDGLLVPFAEISALLVYQPAWDRRIVQAFGRVPGDVQAVVLLHDGQMLPARRTLADLQARWRSWQSAPPADVAPLEPPDAAPPPVDPPS